MSKQETQTYESKIEHFDLHEDQSMTIRDVKVMALGTWHASNAMHPMRYGPTVLATHSTTWADTSVWSTHDHARSITKKVGEVRNPHYADNACVADIYLHGQTQESKDSITLILNKQIDSISAEVAINESNFCEARQIENAKDISFVGAALVAQGACEVCKLNESENKVGDNMETEEYKAKISELEQKITELTAKFEAMAEEAPVVEEVVEEVAAEEAPVEEVLEASEFEDTTTAALDELTATNASLVARIEKLEKTPIVITQTNADEKKEVHNPFK